MADIQFPWEAFIQAQNAKNENQRRMMETFGQTLAGLGQNIGQGLQKRRQLQAQNQLGNYLSSYGQPVQGPITPPALGPMTPMGEMPKGGSLPPAQSKPDIGMIQKLFSSAYPDRESPFMKQMAENIFDQTGTSNKSGKITVYQNEKGEVSRIPKPGFIPTQVSAETAMQFTAIPRSTVQKEGFQSGQLKMRELNKDWENVRKIANPYRSQGIGGASSVFNRAAVGNQAAARGLRILNKPSLTWGEFNAYVNSDVASIQRGGGVPTDVQLHEANYKTFLGLIGQLKTYATGKPATGLVPKETIDQMRENIREIIDVDNRIIDDGLSYVESAYPDAISAHRRSWDNIVRDAEKIKTVGDVDRAINTTRNDETPVEGGMFNGEKIKSVRPIP